MESGSVNLSSIELQLNKMEKKLENKAPRRPRPAMNLNPRNPPSARPGLSLDFTARRSGGTPTSTRNDQPVPLPGLGVVEVEGLIYRGITEKDFIYDSTKWLGSGTSGTVFKMEFKKREVAVKQISKSDDADETKRLLMDLRVMKHSRFCPYIVKYMGCIGSDASVWIIMELMLHCFEKILKHLRMPIPVPVLGSLTISVVSALNYLKEKHSTIHRDVKPSNILVDYQGRIKLCDFGISGRLVDSQARTRSAGCAAYLSPERIDPERGAYDVRADIWSLGLSLIELATAQFPYSNCKSDFEVCAKILQAEAPQLGGNFPADFRDFVGQCCIKEVESRPKYAVLMKTHFFDRHLNRLDRDADTVKWLESSRLLGSSHVPSSGKSSAPGFPVSAIHTPQPISSNFAPLSSSLSVHGRENWTSFGQTPDQTPSRKSVPINSVPVKIENQATNQGDLISF